MQIVSVITTYSSISREQLIDACTQLYVLGKIVRCDIPSLSKVSRDVVYKDLLQEFSNVIRPIGVQEPKHQVQHHIITRGQPVTERARRLSPARLRAAKEKFQDLINQGIYEPSSSPWASPLHMVKNPMDAGGHAVTIAV